LTRRRVLIKNEKGISLIEVLIALAILGLVAAAFLSGLATASMSIFIADERTTAESLARSQMEHVKSQEYQSADPNEAVYLKIEGIPEGYTIWSINRAGDTVEDIIGVPWYSDLPFVDEDVEIDAGLQKIRLVVKHHGKEIFTFIRDGEKITLEGYKVNRNA
jgi:prepilin-type N-terminal cleavage/methylation domain-containing protein